MPLLTEEARRGVAGRTVRWLRRHATVREVLPLLVALGLLAYVASLAVARDSGPELWRIVQATWWLVLLLTPPYLAARLVVWWSLLRQLRVRIPWRQMVVAFAAGEVTKSLPAGIYSQVYLLDQLSHLREEALVRAIVATTAMLGLESLLAVPAGLIIGVPGAPWVAQALLGVVVAWVVILGVVALLVHIGAERGVTQRVAWLRKLLPLTDEAVGAVRDLLAPRTLAAVVPTAVYMLVYVIDLYAIMQAAGLHTLSMRAVIGTYALMVLAVILIPIPTEIGITEFTGLNILLAYGLPRATAAIVILSLRLLATGTTILVAGAVLILLRDELRPRNAAASPPEPG